MYCKLSREREGRRGEEEDMRRNGERRGEKGKRRWRLQGLQLFYSWNRLFMGSG